MPSREWLDSKNPIYVKWLSVWKRNEMLLRGGAQVIESQLRRFDWETKDEADTPFKERVKNAVYINFADMYMTTMSGHLLRAAPKADDDLSFGQLGKVKRSSSTALPTLAELINYNVDGVGNDGSQWDNWWMAAWHRAGATGHRWIFVEAPIRAATTGADQLVNGLRPWLVEYSPVAVPNWDIRQGVLQWAIIRTRTRNLTLTENGVLKGNDGGRGYLFLCRAGVTIFGEEYAKGGWFLFDNDKNPIAAPEGSGNWELTDGDIPMVPLFYRRDSGRDSDEAMDAEPAMSLPGISELNNASVSYMNLSSAADYDVWDAAMSLLFLVNVGPEGWQLATDKKNDGSKWIPIRGQEGMGSSTSMAPQVVDSAAGAVVAEIFEKRLERKLKEVRQVAMNEAVLSPDASGTSRQLGFIEGKGPRLTQFASELEQAQNSVIMFLELRAGFDSPAGVVLWPRVFDLRDVVESIKDVFGLEKLAGISSPTMRKKAMRRAIVATGLATDDNELNDIEGEYAADAAKAQEARDAGRINAAKAAQETPPVKQEPVIPDKPLDTNAG